MIRILTTPLLFLRISYPGSAWLGYIAPTFLALTTLGSILVFNVDIPVTGEQGLLNSAVSLFTVAGGFFVAALTILITNDHDVLNSYFIGNAVPKISGEVEPLTRKRFLSLLFGYLSFASFMIVATCLVASLYGNLFVGLKEEMWVNVSAHIAGLALALVSFQLLLLSLVGLHYLTDRLHRSDGRSHFKKPVPKSDHKSL